MPIFAPIRVIRGQTISEFVPNYQKRQYETKRSLFLSVAILDRLENPRAAVRCERTKRGNKVASARVSRFATLCQHVGQQRLTTAGRRKVKTKPSKISTASWFCHFVSNHRQTKPTESRHGTVPVIVEIRQHSASVSWQPGNNPPRIELLGSTYHGFAPFSGIRPEITYAFNTVERCPYRSTFSTSASHRFSAGANPDLFQRLLRNDCHGRDASNVPVFAARTQFPTCLRRTTCFGEWKAAR